MSLATSSIFNTAIGYKALKNTVDYSNGAGGNTGNSGSLNTAVGYQALAANTSGSYNLAQGLNALLSNTTGSYNTALGVSVLNNNLTGSGNIGIGVNAGNNTTGSNNIIVGVNVDSPTLSGSQQLNIGNLLYGTNLYNGGSVTSAPVTNGNFGIGSTSPYAQLSVNAVNGSTNTTLFAIGSSTQSATTTLFVVNNSGNVGIGIAAPVEKLHVAGNILTSALSDCQGCTGIFLGTDAVGGRVWDIRRTATGNNFALDYFNSSWSTALTVLNTNGNVGIGTTSPASTLSVQGNTLLSGNLTVANITATGTLSVSGNTTLAQATSTTFAITNIASGNLLKTATGGAVVPAVAGVDYISSNYKDWNVFGASYLAPTTTLGIIISASSTIGNGTQTGGLTISGGATTTGDLVFAGSSNVALHNSSGTLQVVAGAGSASLASLQTGGLDAFGAISVYSSFPTKSVLLNTSGASYVSNNTSTFGVGTTTPFAKLSVHANNGDTNTTLFAIGSSTQSATTTLFSINNTGVLNFNPAAQVGDKVATFNGVNFLSATTSNNGLLTLGYQAGNALLATTTTAGNTAFGYLALQFATSSVNNTAIGYRALQNTVDFSNGGANGVTNSGTGNTAVGYNALFTNTTGNWNTAIGASALQTNTTGISNSAFGVGALALNTIGQGNNAFGTNALNANTTGGSNVAFGHFALSAATTSSNLTAVGYEALQNQKDTNGGDIENTAVGYQALVNNTYGYKNTAVGYQALENNTIGINNIAFGSGALLTATSSSENTAIGFNALTLVSAGTNAWNGTDNTALGYTAGFHVTTGYENTLIGDNAGFSLTTGGDNTFLGRQAGYALTTGSANVAIGNYVDLPGGVNASQQLNIGNVLYGNNLYNGSGVHSSAPVTNGNFGIGSSSPYAQLSVNAVNGSTNTTLFAIGSSTQSATTTLFTVSNTGNTYIGGNLAVGTTNPNNFSINAAGTVGGAGFTANNNGSNSSPVIGFTSDTGTGLYLPTTGQLGFDTGGAEKARLTATGLGIGTTSPSQILSVQGNTLLSGNLTVASIVATGTLSVSGNTTLAQATSTTFAITNISSGFLLKTATGGAVVPAVAGVDYSNFAYPFTLANNFGLATNATTSPIWFQGGLQASSTSNLVNTNIFGTLGHISSSSNILETFNGQTFLTATTTTSGLLTLGYQAGNALLATTTTAGNTAFGYQALNVATSSLYNTAIGYKALINTVDYSNGGGAVNASNSGSANTAVGYNALNANTTGVSNTAQGVTALLKNTTGNFNTGFGGNTLWGNVTGSTNVAIGTNALAGNFTNYTNANNNVAIGVNAGYSIQSNAGSNLLLGTSAGYSLTTGAYNIALGQNVDLPSNGGSQQLNLGNLLFGTGLYNGGTVSSAPVTNGNFGIGSSSPYAQLSVNAVNGSTNTTLFAIGSSTQSATTTLFAVTNTGNVGIGTASPATKLVVAGTDNTDAVRILSSGNSAYYAGIGFNSVGSGNNGVSLFTETGGGRKVFTAWDNGEVAIGTGYINNDSNNANADGLIVQGKTGIGTTSPFAKFSVHANNGDTNTVLFAIGSSTASATTTLFTVNNIGIASTTGLVISNAGGVAGCATFDTIGTLSNTHVACGGSGGSPFPFTPGVFNSTVVNATGTALQLQGGLYASSTVTFGNTGVASQFQYSGSTGFLGLGSSTPWGQVSINPTATNETAPAFVIGSTTGTSFVVNNIGLVGINTSNPTAKLDIANTANASLSYNILLDARRTSAAASGDSSGLEIKTGNAGSTEANAIIYGIRGADNASTDLVLYAGNTGGDAERLRILGSNGNVGIGTTSPLGLVSINPTATIGTGSAFVIGSSTATQFIVTNSGKVGVGTAAPLGKFEVRDTVSDPGMTQGSFFVDPLNNQVVFGRLSSTVSSADNFIFQGRTGGKVLEINNNTAAINIGDQSNTGNTTPINFYRNGALKMTIDTNGLVGIGSSSPYAQLSVNAVAGSTNKILFAIGSSTASATTTLFTVNNIGIASTTGLVISNAGGVAGCATLDTLGTLSNTHSACGGSSGTSPFTFPTINSAVTAATTSPLAVFNTAYFGATGTTTVTSAGSLGIGSSTPWGQLSVNPTAANGAAPAFVIGSTTGTSLVVTNAGTVGIGTSSPWARASIDTSNLAAGVAEFVVGSSTRTDFAINQSGYVGVGTTSGTAIFNIQGTANATAQILDISGNSGASYMHITSAGNIGIGSTTPWALLSINPTAALGTAPAFVVGSTSATRFIIDNGGKVGIGTSTPTSRLSLTDAVATAQQTIAYDSSDYASFLVNSVGSVVISPSGNDATFQGTNLRICDKIAGCWTPTATSTTGNLFVENAIEIGEGFSLKEIDTSDLGLYNASGGLMVTFDNGI